MQNMILKIIGFYFLTISKYRNFLKGYKKPKPISKSDIESCIKYDIKIVNHWLKYASEYIGKVFELANKNVLELGPGSDLGTGVIILAKGANSYTAIDINDLATDTNLLIYNKLLNSIKNEISNEQRSNITKMVQKLSSNESPFRYIVDKNFEFSKYFVKQEIDVVFSQAAFEHFDNVENVIAQLSRIVRKGGILLTEIDLKSHSRWIRDKDPNNIYRFSNRTYKFLKANGIPNRLRPIDYKNILTKYGWSDITIIPLKTTEKNKRMTKNLDKNFSGEIYEMELLEIMLIATR